MNANLRTKIGTVGFGSKVGIVHPKERHLEGMCQFKDRNCCSCVLLYMCFSTLLLRFGDHVVLEIFDLLGRTKGGFTRLTLTQNCMHIARPIHLNRKSAAYFFRCGFEIHFFDVESVQILCRTTEPWISPIEISVWKNTKNTRVPRYCLPHGY